MLDIARSVERLPDEAAEPELKQAVSAARQDFESDPDAILGLALMRVLQNVVLAYARWLRDRLDGIRDNFNKSLEKITGGFAAAMVTALVVGLPAFYVLTTFFPSEFRAILTVAKMAKLMIP